MRSVLILIAAVALVHADDVQVNTTSTTESMTTLKCENGTCSTEETAVTTAKPITNQTKKVGKWDMLDIKTETVPFTPHQGSLCLCDLMENYCDINCCCDLNCSKSDKLSFKTCDAPNIGSSKPKINFCQSNKNASSQEWNEWSNSLFCITKVNLPTSYYKQPKKIIRTYFDAQREISISPIYQWYDAHTTEEVYNNNQTNMIQGSTVFLITNGTQVEPLKIPYQFTNGICRQGKLLKYLEDVNIECEGNFQILPKNLTIYVLSHRQYLKNLLENKTCSKTACVPLNITVCNETKVCNNLTAKFESICSNHNCTNVITNANYYFYHNGSEGIKKARLEITLKNLTKVEFNELQRKLTVKFLWHNQTYLNYSTFKSGNPGYLMGKPILIGKLMVRNETHLTNGSKNATKIVRWIERAHDKYGENFMILPESIRGKCVLSPNEFATVKFGFNAHKKCNVEQGFKVANNASIADICRALQRRILAYWNLDVVPNNGTVANLSVGISGNAKKNNLNDWKPFVFENEERNISGISHRNKTVVECFNISSGINFNIFHRRDVNLQESIVAVYVKFSKITTLQLLKHSIKSDYFQISFPLNSQVLFYDITEDRFLKYVDPPSLRINLPHDFFYPFVKVPSGTVRKEISGFACVCTTLFILFVI